MALLLLLRFPHFHSRIFVGSQVQNSGQYIEQSVRFRSRHRTKGFIVTLICSQYIYVMYQNEIHSFTY